MHPGKTNFYLTPLFCLCVLWNDAFSQNILSEIDHDKRHEYNRMIILSGGVPELHPSIYAYWRSDLVSLADTFSSMAATKADWTTIQDMWDQNNEFVIDDLKRGGLETHFADSTKTFYYKTFNDQTSRYRLSERPLLKTFYRTPAHFYEIDVKDFYLRVNPLIRLAAGKETNEDVTTFINQRGIQLRGGIGHNVYFSTSLYDSQVRFPNYVNQFTDEYGVVPGVGFYKPYESAFLKITKGRDFLLAHAYVGVDLGKYIGFQLGHNQHFIGDGIRTLFLSDFSTPFFSLKLNTRIWKFHYQNIFAELAADDFSSVNGISEPIPKKYLAAHYLSFKPRHNISLGLFEAVVFNREGHRFELQYLNPVILYRTVEGSLGSPDNVLLGVNGRWDIRKRVSVYGQVIIDDLLVREILNGNMDWWGNKFGYQLGAQYINAAGIDNLDLQAEYNSIRPYTYSHYDENANYSHFKQALAHPLGANFNEVILALRYKATPKLSFYSALHIISKGEDGTDSVSYGGNILFPNTLRPGDYGHAVGQGVSTDLLIWNSSITYQVSSGLNVDLQYLYRKKESCLAGA